MHVVPPGVVFLDFILDISFYLLFGFSGLNVLTISLQSHGLQVAYYSFTQTMGIEDHSSRQMHNLDIAPYTCIGLLFNSPVVVLIPKKTV